MNPRAKYLVFNLLLLLCFPFLPWIGGLVSVETHNALVYSYGSLQFQVLLGVVLVITYADFTKPKLGWRAGVDISLVSTTTFFVWRYFLIAIGRFYLKQ